MAEILGNLGESDAAVGLLAEASELMERNHERFIEPEIYRIKGALALKRISEQSHEAPDTQAIRSEAERSFRHAIAIAQRGEAKMFELRAAIGLSRLLIGSGRRDEARSMLKSCHGWFTEGFDTLELKESRALLDDLG